MYGHFGGEYTPESTLFLGAKTILQTVRSYSQNPTPKQWEYDDAKTILPNPHSHTPGGSKVLQLDRDVRGELMNLAIWSSILAMPPGCGMMRTYHDRAYGVF